MESVSGVAGPRLVLSSTRVEERSMDPARASRGPGDCQGMPRVLQWPPGEGCAAVSIVMHGTS